MQVGIIDYKCGNIQSVENALVHLGHEVFRIKSPSELNDYSVIVLPGVGAFGPAMESLRESGFIEPLNKIVEGGETTIVGICLGMQLMCNVSFEHGKHIGLGWIDAEVRPIREFDADIKVPHIGWNDIEFTKEGVGFGTQFNGKDFYFVHSFCVKANDQNQVVAECTYGSKFACIVRNHRVIGIQFHPEKSQDLGLRLLDQAIRIGISLDEGCLEVSHA